ncbi:MAG: heat shock protein DnaJ domain protein [Vampirovibrio sp.]|jgi:curved DNA-binding protein CbpA|nr:heat shock protein DnaJ domain protein [Vampirovibrio sp.]
MKDYYKILQIHPEASLEVMNNAYRTLVRQYHPDLYHSHRRSPMNEKMQEINEAYSALSNPITRADYDRRYRQQAGNGATVGSAPAATAKDVLKRVILWGLGTYVVVKFLIAPFMASPLVKIIVLVAALFLMMRLYSKRKS